jgi:hypothetical protein
VQLVHQRPQLLRGAALDQRHLNQWHLDSDHMTAAPLIPRASSPRFTARRPGRAAGSPRRR